MRNSFLARFVSAPAMLAPLMLDRFRACLDIASVEWSRFQERDAQVPAQMEDGFWYAAGDWRAQFRPYVVKDGVLHIPVKGVLLNDFPFAFGAWATGYEYIWRAFQRGLEDGNVRAIALVEDSPGGEVAGNFDLVDRIFAARGQKPIRAFAAESAYSAAYSIASAADQITVTRTGGVGSIGVVTMHIDVSKALDDDGYKITFIHAGKHKVDGNAYEPLPDEVKARIQARIDGLYDLFVATVARNRGLEESAVRSTEALTYSASEALSVRLADNIGSLDDALAAFAADPQGASMVAQTAASPAMKNQNTPEAVASLVVAVYRGTTGGAEPLDRSPATDRAEAMAASIVAAHQNAQRCDGHSGKQSISAAPDKEDGLAARIVAACRGGGTGGAKPEPVQATVALNSPEAIAASIVASYRDGKGIAPR